MADLIKLRRATAAQWTSVNPVLSLGEPGWDTTNNQLRFGDGATTWTGLAPIGGSSGGPGNAGSIAFTPAGHLASNNVQAAIAELDSIKLRSYVLDVKDFGAVGDGSTDDTAAIQAAINATQVNPLLSGGVPVARIILGPGVFRITNTLTISRRAVIFEGNGIGNLANYGTNPGRGTTIRWAGAAGAPMIRITDSWWCDFSNIFFWPGSAEIPSEGILFESPTTGTIGTNSRLRISRCRFGQVAWGAASGTFEYCVRIGGASNTNNDEFAFSDCEFMRGNTAAVAVDNTQSVWGEIRNCLVANSGIGLLANSDVSVFNLTCNHNTLDVKIMSSNTVNIFGWWSEHAVQHAVLTAAGGKLHVFGGKLLFDTEWSAAALPSIDHQVMGTSGCVALHNLWFSNSTGTTHVVKGRGNNSSTIGTFTITDCIGLSAGTNLDMATVSSPTTGGLVVKVDSRQGLFRKRITGTQTLTFTTNIFSPEADIEAGTGFGVTGTTLTATGLTGATQASRYVGATTTGSPTTGTFVAGDFCIDRAGSIWICTVSGTPGTWVSITGGGGGGAFVALTGNQSIAGEKTFTNATIHSASSTDTTPFGRVADVILQNTSSTANNYMTVGHNSALGTVTSGMFFQALNHTTALGRIGLSTRTAGGFATRLTVDDAITVTTGTVLRAPLVANLQTGTTYTLVLTDAGKVVELSNAAAITVTVPPNSSVAFPIGTVICFTQIAAGQATISPGAGVTIRTGSSSTTRAQWSELMLRKRATDEWVLSGDLA